MLSTKLKAFTIPMTHSSVSARSTASMRVTWMRTPTAIRIPAATACTRSLSSGESPRRSSTSPPTATTSAPASIP